MWAVMATTGKSTGLKPLARMRRVASRPSITGICTSISTRPSCGDAGLSSRSSASCPLAARITSSPACSSSSCAICALISLSSTTSTARAAGGGTHGQLSACALACRLDRSGKAGGQTAQAGQTRQADPEPALLPLALLPLALLPPLRVRIQQKRPAVPYLQKKKNGCPAPAHCPLSVRRP